MRARTEAVADFAAALRELRNSVGNPSFREMSGRSGAISHTTLHEATKGNRLPSWGTTVEFVKACGADPDDYQERWEQANLTVRANGTGGLPVLADVSVASSATEPQSVHVDIGERATQPVDKSSDSLPAPEGGGRFRLVFAVVLASAVLGVAVFGVVIVNRDSGAEEGRPSVASASPKAASPVCPVTAPQVAAAQPLHKGDAAQFIADVTLPDCTRVGSGKTVVKVWRFKNVGTVRWQGYSLLRLDLPQREDQCRTKNRVSIKDTRPGGTVDVRTEVFTPKSPGLCYVRFKMMDASGRVAFPGSRPVNFQVIVN